MLLVILLPQGEKIYSPTYRRDDRSLFILETYTNTCREKWKMSLGKYMKDLFGPVSPQMF